MFLHSGDVSLQIIVLLLDADDVSNYFLISSLAINLEGLVAASLRLMFHAPFDSFHDFWVHGGFFVELLRQPIVNHDALVVLLGFGTGVVVQRLKFFGPDVGRGFGYASNSFDDAAVLGEDDDLAGRDPVAEDVNGSPQPPGDRRVPVRNDPFVLVEHRDSLHKVHQLTFGFDHLDGKRLTLHAD